MINKSNVLELREIQLVSLSILKTIADICDEQGLRYVLLHGTLLGAVRHNGFIPWDDDIDIAMPRPDYEKLLKYFDVRKKEMLPLVAFNDRTTRRYQYAITRICDTRYEISTENERDCGMGVFIDVYPIDGLGDDYESAKKKVMENECYLYRIINYALKERLDLKWKGGIVRKSKHIGKWLYYHVFGIKSLVSKMEKNLKEFPDFDHSQYVACAVWFFFQPYEKGMWKREYFRDRIKMQFEQYDFYVPKDYDELLRLIYGDYMQMPPIEERIPHHHYIAWRK